MTDSQMRELIEKSPTYGQRAVYENYCGYVYAITANYLKNCGSSEDIEDCVADTFVEIFRLLTKKNEKGKGLKGLISVVAKRRAIDRFRSISSKNNKTVSIDDMEEEISENASISENAERLEIQHILIDCVKKLGEPDSDIVIQHYYYGRSCSQIGDKLRMSESSIQKRIQRARAKLKKMLEKFGISGEL